MIAQSDDLERALQENLTLRQQLAAKVDRDNSKSQRFRLNGWQRIGIVLSVLWAIGGFFWGNTVAIRDGTALANLNYQICLDQPNHDYKVCTQTFYEEFEKGAAGHWYVAAFVAFVPIPIAWLIAYALIGLVRWIRRGFVKSQ